MYVQGPASKRVRHVRRNLFQIAREGEQIDAVSRERREQGRVVIWGAQQTRGYAMAGGDSQGASTGPVRDDEGNRARGGAGSGGWAEVSEQRLEVGPGA